MRLVRVQVPEFRALKDVDITFEPEFTPQVFPLGSLNGGGKSTLLQLIFVLLHCHSANDRWEPYLKNITELIANYKKTKFANFATITLLTRNGRVTLDYYYGERENVIEFLEKTKSNYPFYKCDYPYFFSSLAFLDKHEITDVIINETLKEIREGVFLIAPSNQSYIFLTKEERRLLFTSNSEKSHDQVIKRLKNSFPNFFTYDFIDVLTEVFRLARDKDFKEKSETGVYGTHYDQLENAINSLFIDGKKIIPLTIDQKRHTKDSIQSMGFKLPSGEEIYPEDLSHGELKRLTIFVLLKYYEIQDSIVLMDEIENGFHLDWQYTIVRDLVEWGKTNQYVLATHSYELCTAVTPAHVKEIAPKLMSK